MLSDAHAAALTPPLTPVPNYLPASGSLGASMVAQGGQSCGWSGDGSSLEVVVAIPFAAGLRAARAAATSTGQPSDALQADSVFFEVSDGVGRAQIFMGSEWFEVASPAFATPDEAESVYALVISDLRSAGG